MLKLVLDVPSIATACRTIAGRVGVGSDLDESFAFAAVSFARGVSRWQCRCRVCRCQSVLGGCLGHTSSFQHGQFLRTK